MSPLLTPEEVAELKALEQASPIKTWSALIGIAVGMVESEATYTAALRNTAPSLLAAAELLPLLAEALEWLLGDPDPIQRFEDRAEAFYRETRIMAPGKDMPAASSGTDDYDERRRAWQAWIDKNTEAARAALEAYRLALGEA